MKRFWTCKSKWWFTLTWICMLYIRLLTLTRTTLVKPLCKNESVLEWHLHHSGICYSTKPESGIIWHEAPAAFNDNILVTFETVENMEGRGVKWGVPLWTWYLVRARYKEYLRCLNYSQRAVIWNRLLYMIEASLDKGSLFWKVKSSKCKCTFYGFDSSHSFG